MCIRDSSDTVLARFYLAKDYSAIYRMDTNLPTLIFGSAQSMLGQEGEVSVEEQNFATEEENKQGIEGIDVYKRQVYPIPLNGLLERSYRRIRRKFIWLAVAFGGPRNI